MSVSPATSTLSPDGLSEDQLLHFADHGWVVLDGVLEEDVCQRTIDAIERGMAVLGNDPDTDDRLRQSFREPHLFDDVFLEPHRVPGVLTAFRQLIGLEDFRYLSSFATIKAPEPDRRRNPESADPANWGWHRDFRPKWNIFPHDTDPRLINAMLLTVATYYTPMSPEDGVTALLDGSHRFDELGVSDAELQADYQDRFPLVQPTAGPGSILVFNESLAHAVPAVLSDRTRYASFTWIGAAWVADKNGRPPHEILRYADDGLFALFRPPEREGGALPQRIRI
jgi:hypothetical protein